MHRTTRSITNALLLLVFAFVPALGGVAPALAAPKHAGLTVDDDGVECPAPDYNTIQDAVDAAGDGETIQVCAGTYEEQVLIDGFNGLTLTGKGAPTIQPAAGADGAIVWVRDSSDVTIKGFVVDGAEHFAGGCSSGDDRMFGVYYLNSSGAVKDNLVDRIRHSPLDGCQEGVGIYALDNNDDGHTSSVDIVGNSVSDYQKNGITANLDVEAKIQDNAVEGFGEVNNIAQNGIQLGYGAAGTIRDNSVDGNYYTGANWAATGILLFQVSGVMVKDNVVSENQAGIDAEAWCFAGGPSEAGNNKILKNTIDQADFGVIIAAYVLGSGYSECDPAENNNKVVNNTISSDDGDTGVFVGTGYFFGGESSGFTPTADNNKVIDNDISGFTTGIDDSGTATKVHANAVTP